MADNFIWPPPNLAHAKAVRRNWAMWRAYVLGGTTYRAIGRDYGITGNRVRQIVEYRKRKLRAVLHPGINVQWDNVSDEVREATLGIEFVFRNELTVSDRENWEQVEPAIYSSAYSEPIPEWRREWGHQDTSPAKDIPANTLYRIKTTKEQTDADDNAGHAD